MNTIICLSPAGLLSIGCGCEDDNSHLPLVGKHTYYDFNTIKFNIFLTQHTWIFTQKYTAAFYTCHFSQRRSYLDPRIKKFENPYCRQCNDSNLLHFTRIFFDIVILAFVNTVKCPYRTAEFVCSELRWKSFSVCCVVMVIRTFATTLKVEHSLQALSKKKRPEEVGHSDLTHDPICYFTICYVPLNFCMTVANYVIYHCHTDLLEVSL